MASTSGDNQSAHVATIRDVAQLARTSITTVSHVFNRPDRVAESTRERVLKVAADLSYRPNVHARQLVTRQNRSLAIQVAGQATRRDRMLVPNSEYFLEVLNGAARAADESGYALILTPPDVDPSALESFAVEGVLLVDPAGDEAIFAQSGPSASIVTTGRPNSTRTLASVVDNDHATAAIEVMDHLHANGYTRPAVVVSDQSRSYVLDLIAGYRAWAKGHRLTPIVIDLASPDSISDVFGQLRKRRVDAVYTSSENIALDVMLEARRRGIDIPDQLGLASAVDSSLLRLTSPEVTGVFLHPHEIGQRAADLLIELVEGTAEPGGTVKVAVELMVRGSTRRV
jgi:DNA-binding LacI/PurR family transcriptional regulator